MTAIGFAGAAMVALLFVTILWLAVSGTERPWLNVIRTIGIMLGSTVAVVALIAAFIGLGLLLGLPLVEQP